MIDQLRKVYRLLQALAKLLPAIIEVLEDLADDGKLNKSTGK